MSSFPYRTIEDVDLADLKSRATMIHFFGLGFIQIKLGPKHRMHIYTKRLPRIVPDNSAHNHRYDFSALVLAGALKQDLLDLWPGETHLCENESCQEGKDSADQTSYPCTLHCLSSQSVASGGEYFLDRDTFHTVEHTTGAVTILELGAKVKSHAQVVYPVDKPRVCPFSQKISEQRLWCITEEVLRFWRHKS